MDNKLVGLLGWLNNLTKDIDMTVKKVAKKEEKEQTTTEKSKDCFVIMPISDPDGYDSGHFQRVYSHLIKGAVVAAGFKPKRADDVKSTNYIMIDILQRIIKSDLVICDLSSKNPNVMYELGIRQAFNLPSVLISDRKTERVFDIEGIRTVRYDENLRVDLVQDDIINITSAINETIAAKPEDINSLIQLLGIPNAAKLSNSNEISGETKLLMNGIRDIAQRMTRLEDSAIKERQNIYSTLASTRTQSPMIWTRKQPLVPRTIMTTEKGILSGSMDDESED